MDNEGRRQRKNAIAQKSRNRCREAKKKEQEDLDNEIKRYHMKIADAYIELNMLKYDICKGCSKPRGVSV